MKTGISLFKSKVAKRIFFLFLISAILPIAALAYLSYAKVSTQLREQSMTRLQNAARSYGLVLYERFCFLESELGLYGSSALSAAEGTNSSVDEDSLMEQVQEHFNAIAFIPESAPMISLTGEMNVLPEKLKAALADKPLSRTLFHYEQTGEGSGRIFLAKPTSDPNGHPGLLLGDIDTEYLWGIGHYGNILPPLTDSCVLDYTRNIVFSSFHLPSEVLFRISVGNDTLESRSFEYTSNGERFFSAYWSIFLNSKFEGPNLIVVLRNLHTDVFEPLSQFKTLFPLVTLLALWIVLLLSAISIRKSMVPLEKLKEGAIRLAHKEFDTRVEVHSGDEYEDLADVFNDSAATLGRQFSAMEAMAEIDGAVHASLNTKDIINTSLKRMFFFFACDSIVVGLWKVREIHTMQLFSCTEPNCEKLSEEFLSLTPEDAERLSEKFDYFQLTIKDRTPSFLPHGLFSSQKHFLVLPLFHNKGTNGIICLGHAAVHSYTETDLVHAKRLSNQVSAALSNAFFVEELEVMNWGTLEALARTVDAKSKWTAGHSERVAELSVKIARVMGLDEKSIDMIHRGGYLHDIGKIGVPVKILDKPGELTDEEYIKIKEHPEIGAKIIEPIEAYAEAIPIIRHHHERFDGKGYPHGLSGNDLTIGTRILSVADVYDALVSNRPYRQGWIQEKAIRLITEGSGKHFDPKVVDAFLTAVS